MKPQGIIVALLWSGTLAFFGYLLVISIPTVASSLNVDADVIKTIASSGTKAIVAFFAFLGAVIGLLQHHGVKSNDLKSEESVDADEQVAGTTVEKYKEKLHQTYAAALRLKEIARHNRHIGIKAMSYRVAMNVALLFAISHIVTAGLQGVLQRAYPPAQQEGVQYFAIAFAQTLMLCVCAAIIPFFCYKRFRLNTKYSSKANSTGTVIRVGGLGIFCIGVASLTTLSPEQISTLLGSKSIRSLPVFHINYLSYLAFVRLLVFPLIGIMSCYFARKTR